MHTSYIYYAFYRKKYAPEIGAYHSYDIVVYDDFFRRPVQIVRDVSPDLDLVFCMIEKFNRFHLSPLHLKDAIVDMLDKRSAIHMYLYTSGMGCSSCPVFIFFEQSLSDIGRATWKPSFAEQCNSL